jgi:hypothetical protein
MIIDILNAWKGGFSMMKKPLECMSWVNGNSENALVAEASAYGNALAANSAAAAQHGSAGLGLHARAEAVCFHTVAAVGLKCALRHGNALLFPLENLCFRSISEYSARRARKPARTAGARAWDDPAAELQRAGGLKSRAMWHQEEMYL